MQHLVTIKSNKFRWLKLSRIIKPLNKIVADISAAYELINIHKFTT
jgi:hypothetical protein